MPHFGEQRIADPILRRIESTLATMFKVFGVNKKPIGMRFGKAGFGSMANYFELSPDRLALCYHYKNKHEELPLSEFKKPGEMEGVDLNNRELLGFSGVVKKPKDLESKPAVFLNSQKGTIEEACHTLIHEIVHINSHDSIGFQNAEFKKKWNKKGGVKALFSPEMPQKDRLDNVSGDFYTVVDEGVTEFFARIISHFLNIEDEVSEIPRLRKIPVYEYPLTVACDLARSIGVGKMARAFFHGDLEFHKSLAQIARDATAREKASGNLTEKYGQAYFDSVAQLDTNSANYLPVHESEIPKEEKADKARRFFLSKKRSENTITVGPSIRLMGMGVDLPDSQKVAHTTRATYNDPAVAVWNEQIKERVVEAREAIHPAVLMMGGIAGIFAAYKIIKG